MKKKLICSLVLIASFVLFACTSTPVKYYASDACLVKKGETTKKDILALFGQPDTVENRPDGSENWYYYNVKEKLIDRIPYVREKFPQKEIEIIKVEFAGEIVSTCYYTVKKETK